MFKTGVRSYLKNLPHFFTVLGVVALFVIISLFICIPMMIDTSKVLVDNVSKTLNDAKLSQDEINKVINALTEGVRALDWSKPLDAFQTMFNQNWFLNIIKNAIPDWGSRWEGVQSALINSFTLFTKDMLNELLLIPILFLVGSAASVVVTKIAIDMNMKANNNPIRYILSFIIDVLLFVGIWYLFIYCVLKTSIAFYFLLIGIFVVMVLVYPLQNTFVYGRGKVKLKDVFTFRNILGLALATLIGYGLSFGIVFACYRFFNQPFAFVISAPLFILTYLVCENASRTYICDLYYDKKNEEKVIKKINKQEQSKNNN